MKLCPSPSNVSSVAVMQGKFLLLLENKKAVSVYIIGNRYVKANNPNTVVSDKYISTHSYFSHNRECSLVLKRDNRVGDINHEDLGLPEHCELENIWAGETTYPGILPKVSVLHVQYRHPEHGQALASYSVDEYYLQSTDVRQ